MSEMRLWLLYPLGLCLSARKAGRISTLASHGLVLLLRSLLDTGCQRSDAEAEAEGRTKYLPFHDDRHPARQPFIFPKKKTYPSPPMVGTPMQFP